MSDDQRKTGRSPASIRVPPSRRAAATLIFIATIFAVGYERVRADEPKSGLPDRKTIDALILTIPSSPSPLGGMAHLSISKTGKVGYSHESAPFTGSGGIVTTKQWDMAVADTEALLRGAIEDGLLEIPTEEKAVLSAYQVLASYGRWQASMSFKERPEKLHKRVLPLLQHAHPEQWLEPSKKAVADDKRSVLPDNKSIDSLSLSITPKLMGAEAKLSLSKSGKVIYTDTPHPNGEGGRLIRKEWEIPRAEAAAILQGGVEDGILESVDVGQAVVFPHYYLSVTYGRWQTSMHLKESPDKLLVQVMPLLQRAHPELWGQSSQK